MWVLSSSSSTHFHYHAAYRYYYVDLTACYNHVFTIVVHTIVTQVEQNQCIELHSFQSWVELFLLQSLWKQYINSVNKTSFIHCYVLSNERQHHSGLMQNKSSQTATGRLVLLCHQRRVTSSFVSLKPACLVFL